MKATSRFSKPITIALGFIVPIFWLIIQAGVSYYLLSHKISEPNILFIAHLSGILFLLAITPLYQKFHRKIKLGKPFNKKSILPTLSILLIYILSTAYELLSGTNQEAWVKSVIQTPWIDIAPLFVAIFVLAPIGEEIIFRGYMTNSFPLEKKGGLVAAAIVTTLIFSLLHVQYKNIISFIELAILSVVLIWARVRSEGIGLPIILHFITSALAILSALILP